MLDGLREAKVLLDPQALADDLSGPNGDFSLQTGRYAREMDNVRRFLNGEPGPFRLSEREGFSALLSVRATMKTCHQGDNWEAFLQDSLLLANQMLFYGSPTAYSDFWQQVVQGDCWESYPPRMQAWLQYVNAALNWDDAEISRLGRNYVGGARIERNFVLLTLLAADIRQGHYAKARELLDELDLTGIALNAQLLALIIQEQTAG